MKKIKNKRIAHLNIAMLTPEQIQKLKDYEKEMDIILVAYKKGKVENEIS